VRRRSRHALHLYHPALHTDARGAAAGAGSESEQTLRHRMSAVQDTLHITQEGRMFDVTILEEVLDKAVTQVISLLLPSLRQNRRVVCILGGAASGKGT
jgi:hypothetical protein